MFKLIYLSSRKIELKLFNYMFELSRLARHPWTHFKVHPIRDGRFGPSYGKHIVWGKLSLVIGQPHLVPVLVHTGCGGPVHGVGEDGIDYCEDCEHICEGESEYITTEEFEART